MTVIAWDGKTLAADRQCTSAGLVSSVTKVFQLSGGVYDRHYVGVCGNMARAMELVNWLETFNGDPVSLPDFQRDDDLCVLMLVISPEGQCFEYGASPYPHEIASFHAIGDGCDFAMAAMHCGETAEEAVRIACVYSSTCGRGVDSFRVVA